MIDRLGCFYPSSPPPPYDGRCLLLVHIFIPGGGPLQMLLTLVNLSDAVYATSTMDLRLRYFSQSARVPLHPIQYSLLHPSVRPCRRGNILYIRRGPHFFCCRLVWLHSSFPAPDTASMATSVIVCLPLCSR